MTMFAAARPASVSSSASNSRVELIAHLDSRQEIRELALQVDDAQGAALVGRGLDLLAERGEHVEAVDAREAADGLADIADRREVAGIQRLAHALEVAAPAGEERRHQLLQLRLDVEMDLFHAWPLSARPRPAAAAAA